MPDEWCTTMRNVFAVARKDLVIEWRARLLLVRVLPFALLVLVLFAVALDSEALLTRAAAGLVWLAAMFATLLVVQRCFDIETADGALDMLLTSVVEPSRVFFGKVLAVAAQLLVLVVVLLGGAVVLYGVRIDAAGLVLLVTTVVTAVIGLAGVGTLYGAVVAQLTGRDSLLPLLAMPMLAPLLIGASRATEAAFGSQTIDLATGWAWASLLAVFGVVFAAAGAASFATLTEPDA
jgi:heme exporter protein B